LRARKVVLLVLPALALFLFACQSKPGPVITSTPTITPLEIVSRSADAMLSVESLHFNIERDGALAYIDSGNLLAFKRAQGDFQSPDRMRAVVRVITAFTPVDIGMVALGDEQYTTDPITGEWGRLPPEWGQLNLVVIFDPETGIQQLLKDGVIDLELVGTEEIDGRLYYRISGQASGERMYDMTLGFIGQGDVELDIWVDAEDYYVRRLHVTDPVTDPENPTTWTLEFSNFGQAVEVW
jgi:lipoprotein LprG